MLLSSFADCDVFMMRLSGGAYLCCSCHLYDPQIIRRSVAYDRPIHSGRFAYVRPDIRLDDVPSAYYHVKAHFLRHQRIDLKTFVMLDETYRPEPIPVEMMGIPVLEKVL